MKPVRILVRDTSGNSGSRPISGGIPLSQGEAPAGTMFRLLDGDGQALPLQAQILARWQDGSARWLYLDTLADLAANSRHDWRLDAAAAADTAPLGNPGNLGNLGNLGDPAPGPAAAVLETGHTSILLEAILADGTPCQARVTEERLECDGPVRRTLCRRGELFSDDGGRAFQFRLRVSTFAGSTRVRLEPLVLFDCDAGIIQRLQCLNLMFRPRHSGCRAVIGSQDDAPLLVDPGISTRLLQQDDQQVTLGAAEPVPGRAPGWAELHDDEGTLAVALRDFWQQWPKSLETTAEGTLVIGLLPAFEAGTFKGMEPWYKHQYLFDGNCYRLRTGQARKWDVWLNRGGGGPALARQANAPTVLTAAPADAIATGVWDAIAPAGTPATAEYDPWADDLYEAYRKSIRAQRDYGAMNWGDWFGERQVNWGNHEYDTVNQLLIQFARTGDPKYFLSADAAARHSTEVDVIHALNDDLKADFAEKWPREGFPARPGMVHEHCVGHVGSFYPVETIRKLFVEHDIGHNEHPYLCLDPFNLGHIWTQGMVRYYFLTGDPFVRETVECIGDNLVRLVLEDGFDFGIDDPHFGRAAGWPLLALAGAYELDFGEHYLAAMKELVDRALARQDPCCGGWLYQLYPGHCLCTTRQHVGMAGFITSILVNGLSRYGLLTGDERIPEAVSRAVSFLDNDTWIDQRAGWRYTSCPASSFTGQAGVTMMAHVNAVRLARDPEHRRVLCRAWDAKFKALRQTQKPGPGQGKAYTASAYGCAETVGVLATDGYLVVKV